MGTLRREGWKWNCEFQAKQSVREVEVVSGRYYGLQVWLLNLHEYQFGEKWQGLVLEALLGVWPLSSLATPVGEIYCEDRGWMDGVSWMYRIFQ